MDNINPCKGCVVDPICLTPCDPFRGYVQDHLENVRTVAIPISDTLITAAAIKIRAGEFKLSFNKWGYMLCHEESL